MAARFLHWKVNVHHLIINVLWGDLLRFGRYSVVKLESASFSIRWWFFLEAVVTVFVSWWFSSPIRPSAFTGWHPTGRKSSSCHSSFSFICVKCELMDSCSIPWALICYYRFILGSDCCIYGRWEPLQSGGFCVLWAGPLRCWVCCALWLRVLQARLCSPWSSFELAASPRSSAWLQ